MPRHLFFSKEPSLLFAEPVEGDTETAEVTASDVKLPQWVHILPKPDKNGLIHSRDNRILHVDDLEKLAARSNAALKKQKGGGPVDADHRIYGWPGGGAALGWAEAFEVRPSGLWAQTDWLDEGKDLITKKLYRYTSSVVTGEMEPEIDEEAWSVTWHITPDIVEGYALTNIPALTTHALFSQTVPLGFAAPGERDEALQVLLRKMGLSAHATPTDIREAWAAFSKRLAAASVSLAVPAAPAPAASPTPAPPAEADDDDGRDDDDDVAEDEDGGEEGEDGDDDAHVDDEAKPGTVEAQLAAANARIRKFEEEAGAHYVDELVHSGKLTPAQKPAALAQAKTEKGLQHLRALYEHAQPIISPNAPSARRTSASSSSSAPPGVDPLAYELAGKEPAHVIAARIKQRDTKEHSA